jgi:hypothetical protein
MVCKVNKGLNELDRMRMVRLDHKDLSVAST